MERSIDLITVNLSLSILGDQILVRFFSSNERLYDPGVFKRVCTFIVVIIIISFSFLFFLV